MTKNPFKKPSRRQVLAGGAAAALAATAGGLAAPAVHAQSGKKIRFLNSETGIDTLAVFDRLAKEYQDKTGVEVVIDSVPLSESFTKLTNGSRSGTPYDIANLGFIGHVMLLAEQGHIVPVNELTDPYDWGNNILFPLDGKVYWYPYDYNLALIHYRKDLYAEKGLSVPTTWDQFVANCEATAEGRRKGALFPIGSNGATNWMSVAFMWAEGVQLFGSDWSVILDNADMKPRAAAYLDFFEKLYGTFPPGAMQASYSTVLSNMVAGTIAHGAYAGRLIESAERDNPEIASELGVMPYMDSSGKQQAVSLGYDGWVVLNTDNTGPAMEFMKWLTEDRLIDFLHTAPVHFQPTRIDLYDNPRWRDNDMIRKYAEEVELMRNLVTNKSVVVTSIDTQGPTPDLRAGKVFEAFVMPEMLQNKLIKGMDSNEAVEVAADKIRKLTA